jgi:hypothetical protein
MSNRQQTQLASLLIKLGHSKEASQLLETLYEKNPDDLHIKAALIHSLADHDITKAEEYAEGMSEESIVIESEAQNAHFSQIESGKHLRELLNKGKQTEGNAIQ